MRKNLCSFIAKAARIAQVLRPRFIDVLLKAPRMKRPQRNSRSATAIFLGLRVAQARWIALSRAAPIMRRDYAASSEVTRRFAN